jgi:hypothetical protein
MYFFYSLICTYVPEGWLKTCSAKTGSQFTNLTGRNAGRQTSVRQMYMQEEVHAGRSTCRQKYMKAEVHAGRSTCRQKYMQAEVHAGRSTCR